MKALKKVLFTIVIFSFVVAVSVVVLRLLPHSQDFLKIAIWYTIGAEALAMIFSLVFSLSSKDNQISLQVAGYTLSIIYSVVSLGLSILFSVYYRMAYNTFYIFISVLSTLYIIASFVAFSFFKKAYKSAEKAESSSAVFKNLEYKMQMICTNNTNSEYQKTFEGLMDSIRACDQSNYVKTDDLILSELDLLLSVVEASNYEKANVICDKITTLIKQRSIEVNSLKLGGI